MKIEDLYIVVGNKTDIPYIHPSASHNENVLQSIVQYQNKEIEHGPYLGFTSFTYIHLCVLNCMQFYHMCIFVWSPQSKRQFHHNEHPSVFPFKTIANSLPTSPTHIANPWQLLIHHHFHYFIISRILYQWKHITRNLWGRFFSSSINDCRFIQIVAWVNNSFLFIVVYYQWYVCTIVCLTTHPL